MIGVRLQGVASVVIATQQRNQVKRILWVPLLPQPGFLGGRMGEQRLDKQGGGARIGETVLPY